MPDEMFLGHKLKDLKFDEMMGQYDPVTKSTCFLAYHFAKYGNAQAFEHTLLNMKSDHLNRFIAHENNPIVNKLIPKYNGMGSTPTTIIHALIGYIELHTLRKEKNGLSIDLISSLIDINDGLALPIKSQPIAHKSDAILYLEETGFFPENITEYYKQEESFLRDGFNNVAKTLQVFFEYYGEITPDDKLRLQTMAGDIEYCETKYGFGIDTAEVESFLTVAQNAISL